MTSPVTVGIVGTGVGIRTHLAGALHLPDVEVVGVVGSSLERSRELLERAGAPTSLAVPWPELLSTRPDLLCVTTSLAARSAYLDDLAGFGGSVLVEKPVAAGARDAARLEQALGDAFSRSFTDFQLRGLAAFRLIHDLVAQGRLGVVYAVDLFERNSTMRGLPPAPWQLHRSTGGGQAHTFGGLLADLGLFLAGVSYAEALSASPLAVLQTPRGGWPGAGTSEDAAEEVFTFQLPCRDVMISARTTSVSTGPKALEVRLEATEGCVEFRYRDGSGLLHIRTADGPPQDFRVCGDGGLVAADTPTATLNPSPCRVAYPPYLQMIVDAVRGTPSPYLASLRDGADNARLVERAILEGGECRSRPPMLAEDAAVTS